MISILNIIGLLLRVMLWKKEILLPLLKIWITSGMNELEVENDWIYLPLIESLVAVSALIHDWGKASKLFQEKLKPNSRYKFKGDPIRHEWVSVLLLRALINSQEDSNTDNHWLSALIEKGLDEHVLTLAVAKNDEKPLSHLPNAAKLVAWLVVSHHRLPVLDKHNDWKGEAATSINDVLQHIDKTWGYENKYDEEDYQSRVKQCLQFPKGLLSDSKLWNQDLKYWAKKLYECLRLVEKAIENGAFRLVLHHARLCLMLGDHYYSSLEIDPKKAPTKGLYANTDRESKQLKQPLDEHLIGVAQWGIKNVQRLPAIQEGLAYAKNVSKLLEPSPTDYIWQDDTVEKILRWKESRVMSTGSWASEGFFCVNMASTGCGKTYANAKIMQALSVDSKSLRYTLAVGLRTLTLQTGDEYRSRIDLKDDDLAVLIGSRAVLELHQSNNHVDNNEKMEESEATGSASQQSLVNESIIYDVFIPEDGWATILRKNKDRQLLYAPVLVCTIDHIMAATETKRGGRYILPSLRLLSADLVIDEVDDFSGNDSIAITRLVHLAGMLGRKVMISSATIPRALAEGFFNAYKKGWQLYSQSRETVSDYVGCAWVDEFNTQVRSVDCHNTDNAIDKYRDLHDDFIIKRVVELSVQIARRKVMLIECDISMQQNKEGAEEDKEQAYFDLIKHAAIKLHDLNQTKDNKTGINVSFGVVRVANIKPCIAFTEYLLQATYPENYDVRVMAYHSKQVMLLRHEQEKHLDHVLQRKEKKGQIPNSFNDPLICKHLDTATTKNIIFILVATPVEEVGRDHCFDWAIIEPSSYRSIVQLAGRVRRHREGEVSSYNIGLMQYNYRAFKQGDIKEKKYFNVPGYETYIALKTHNIASLVSLADISKRLDAIPRIQEPKKGLNTLARLEHYVINRELCDYKSKGPQTLQGYLSETWYLTALPQKFIQFRDSESSINLYLTSDDSVGAYYFTEKDDDGQVLVNTLNEPKNISQVRRIKHVSMSHALQVRLWMNRNYGQLLTQYAQQEGCTERHISLKYGEISFVEREGKSYEYNDQFGLKEVLK